MKVNSYNEDFFENELGGSLQSARLIVPIVLDLVKPASVVDVGCGRGAWLRAFKENGVSLIKGIDGDYVDRSRLLVSRDCFDAVDLNQQFTIGGKYDLAVCLEVVEHLSERQSRFLIKGLTEAAPIVLFSAAIPGQEGTNHINEQWPAYWQAIFAERGFRRLDPIRRHIWQDVRIEWWYRQNIVLYASAEAIASSKSLKAVEDESTSNGDLEWVHIDIFNRHVSRTSTLRGIAREIPIAVWRKVKRHLVSG